MAITEHPIARAKTVQLANRTSLASQVRRLQGRDEAVQCHGRWVEIQEGYKAYYREHIGPGGEVIPLLAMRVELARQIGVTIPDVVDQASLRMLWEKFHAIDPNPPVPARLTGGGRMAVLAKALTDQILAEPVDDGETGTVESSDSWEATTCHSPPLPATPNESRENGRPVVNPPGDAKGGVTLSPSDAVMESEPSPERAFSEHNPEPRPRETNPYTRARAIRDTEDSCACARVRDFFSSPPLKGSVNADAKVPDDRRGLRRRAAGGPRQRIAPWGQPRREVGSSGAWDVFFSSPGLE